MANFFLVHGAWLGGWCWRRVSDELARMAHDTKALTLTGLGERAHLNSTAVDLETHIADVINAIETEEASDVVLVAHSYAGMLGTAVADRIPERLKHLIYVDAVIPEPGDSWSSAHMSEVRAARIAEATSSRDRSFSPPTSSLFGLSGDDRAWFDRRASRQPLGTYTAVLTFSPKQVAAIRRTYINCTEPALATIEATRSRLKAGSVWGGAWSEGAGGRMTELRTGHLPMISAPRELAAILVDCA